VPAFDWIPFLQHYSIEYVTQGPNVAKGHLNVRCPFCGYRDPSHHMGLQLETGYWACWRERDHRGKRPEKLVAALIHCTWQEAKRIVGTGVVENVEWGELIRRLEAPARKTPVPAPARIRMHPEFFPIESSKGNRGQFLDYLAGRGFGRDAMDVARMYSLWGCLTGDFRFRLVFPILCEGLVGWTARAITKRAVVRYKAHPPGQVLRSCLYNHDMVLAGGRTLAICEGPVDVLKVDFYGQPDVRAVGLMGLFLPPQKLARILTVSAKFQEIMLLLDTEAYPRALQLVSDLSSSGRPITIKQLPHGVKDPGMLTPRQVTDLFQ